MPVKGSHAAVILPPDGTGKQVTQSCMIEVDYNTGTIPFIVGDTVTFSSTTSLTCTVIEVNGNTTTGELHLRVEEPVPDPIPTLVIGENIIVGGSVNAKISTNTALPYYFQQSVIVGANMTNELEIDESGSGQVKFKGGSPEFDAFGKMQGSQQHKIAEYVHSYDELPNDFSTVIVNNSTDASLTYDHNTRGVVLQCGTNAGDIVQRTSDEYHVYQAGVSQLLTFTGAIGDTGKTNVTRRAGYYDDENGAFFELNDSVFNVCMRSKSTGSIVDSSIASTLWNEDRMDGSGDEFNPSGLALDPSKDNIYWVDLQWLGAGRVRFGAVIDGVRFVVHSMNHSNTLPYSYMSTGSLPFRYEQINTGIAASISQFRIFCAVVFTEGAFNPFVRAYTDSSSVNVNSVSETPIIAMRASQTYKTFDNRSTSYPASFSVHNSGAEPILFSMRRGGTVVAGSWVSHGGESITDINKTMTSNGGGKVRFSAMVAGGETKDIPFPAFTKGRRGVRRGADITEWVELTLGAQLLIAGTGGIVYIGVNWDEVRD